MKQFLSLFMLGIGGLFFLAFFTTLQPTIVTAADAASVLDQVAQHLETFWPQLHLASGTSHSLSRSSVNDRN